MAKVLKNGLLSGRVGNLVYFVMNGKQYVRAWVKPANPKTPPQLRHRARVRACSQFLGPFKSVLMIGYQGASLELEEYNEAAKYLMAYALEETTPPEPGEYLFKVIPERVKLSRGHIEKPEILSIERTGQELKLTWNPELGPVTNRNTDALAVVAYVPGRRPFTEYHTGTRLTGFGTLTLPNEYTEPTHLWAFFWNGQRSVEPDKKNVSDSVYLGVF